MSTISEQALELACVLAGLFPRDSQIAARLNEAQSRVHAAKSTRLEIPWP
jgi:hypothetical protein